MNIRLPFGSLLLVVTLWGCKSSTKITAPTETYLAPMENARSIFNIPIELDVEALESSLDEELQGVLFDDNNYNDGDRMRLRAEKIGAIQFRPGAQDIIYSLPLSLAVGYDTGLGILSAQGEITVDLKTAYQIQPDWSIQTQTVIAGHRWIKRPALQLGTFNLPIGTLVDAILRNTRKALGQEIDAIIGETLGLDNVVKNTWDLLFQPLLVAPDYSAWLQVNPTSIGMTPIVLRNKILSSTIIVEAKPLVSVGPRPADRSPDPLPAFTQYTAAAPGFQILVPTQITWEEAERIAKAQILGETYSAGKRKVTIENLELYGNSEKVVVNTKLAGSYNGSIYLTGKPVYHSEANRITIEDLDFTLETKNVLLKSAGWLLRTTIKNRIHDNLNFLVAQNLGDMRSMLESELNRYQLGAGLRLQGQVKDLTLGGIQLSQTGILLNAMLEGEVRITVAR